eukprot:TRINITY_DN579_c0_g1_i1.p1 TRINITY_DN579_c0_g1~~TRINITY_DN579_c0_g1_i1.p1  ORF type:complete len:239 (-),score=22.89 TRINITY_DN579_c0_g1_i1:116-832(-)
MAAINIVEVDDDDLGRVSLIGRNLESMPLDIAIQSGPDAFQVDLTENCIKSGQNLDKFVNLRTLILDKNGLSSLADFPVLPTVDTLWINNNNFADLTSLMNDLERSFPNLVYLSMLRNPACPDVYFSEGITSDTYKRYRLYVIYRLKKLSTLDATRVTPEERQEADRTGRFLQVARPDPSQYEVKGPQPSLLEPTLRDAYAQDREYKRAKPAAYLGKGRMKYDGRQSEGNRFILNSDL